MIIIFPSRRKHVRLNQVFWLIPFDVFQQLQVNNMLWTLIMAFLWNLFVLILIKVICCWWRESRPSEFSGPSFWQFWSKLSMFLSLSLKLSPQVLRIFRLITMKDAVCIVAHAYDLLSHRQIWLIWCQTSISTTSHQRNWELSSVNKLVVMKWKKCAENN